MAPKMKALVTAPGYTANVQEIDVPAPGAGEILVEIRSVAQNPTDWKAVLSVPAGRTVGCDFAGVVADGNGSRWRAGQRVAGFVRGSSSDPARGVFAEYAVADASLVYEIPEGLSFARAAAVPLAFATAVQALFGRLRIPEPAEPAETPFPLLVSGGASSVGMYAVQLAKLAGAYVIATGSPRNRDLLLSLGADAVVNYHDADWPEQVRALSHDGLSHAFDCIAEHGTVECVVRALSPTKGGHVVALLPVGSLRKHLAASGNTKIKLESTIAYTVFGRPLKYGTFDNCGKATPADKAQWEKYLSLLPELLSSGKIKPNPIREFGGIEDIPAGFREQQEGRVSGEKLVYKIA
ncbi:hypothetical protein AAE478_006279 [Parahypoxylon ruwenzoriense]